MRINLFQLICLCLTLLIYAVPVLADDNSAKPSIDKAINIGDLTLHLQCFGEQSPTIVVHSGFNSAGTSGEWQKVIDVISPKNRVCVYDRANLGKSDALSPPYTFGDAAIQLDKLLTKAQVKPPYVMVSHSYGSYPLRLYNHMFADKVSAILLIDPSQYGQWKNKLAKWKPETETYSDKHKASMDEELEYWNNPLKNPEKVDIKTNEALIAKSSNFGDKPYVLLWAKHGDKMGDKPSEFWQGSEQVWHRMKAMFVVAIDNMGKLSTNSKVTYANTTKHYIHYYEPQAVISEIEYLLSEL